MATQRTQRAATTATTDTGHSTNINTEPTMNKQTACGQGRYGWIRRANAGIAALVMVSAIGFAPAPTVLAFAPERATAPVNQAYATMKNERMDALLAGNRVSTFDEGITLNHAYATMKNERMDALLAGNDATAANGIRTGNNGYAGMSAERMDNLLAGAEAPVVRTASAGNAAYATMKLNAIEARINGQQ